MLGGSDEIDHRTQEVNLPQFGHPVLIASIWLIPPSSMALKGPSNSSPRLN